MDWYKTIKTLKEHYEESQLIKFVEYGKLTQEQCQEIISLKRNG